MTMKTKTILLSAAVALLYACRPSAKVYTIGVSQCSADIWREKQNTELRMAAYLKENVQLKFAAAYDSDQRQVQQIDSLVASGIDLLIVAPNQVATISPAIDRAFDRGIPVIVFERKTNSQKYTAFISADNYEMGRTMGQYIAKRLAGHGQVMEVMGLQGSSPAIERHNGFRETLAHYPSIRIVATLQGDWTEPKAYTIVRQWLARHPHQPVDLVFGMNDRTAMGARQAFLEARRPLPLFCGIDALPDEKGGIRLVRDSLLDASYIYPTRGDYLLDVALQILEGKPYQKETRHMSALVTRDNARVLLMESDEVMRQAHIVDQLHQLADRYVEEITVQRAVIVLTCGIIVLLLALAVLYFLYHRGQTTLRRERVVNNLWNAEPIPSPFITRFKEVVEARLPDSELTVDDLAAAMNLSRVQLYRKVKSSTGSSPVELLRTARLNRGYQLLLTTDKTISEVAYSVGFTAPSYFTKCFKEEFGHSPSDMQNHRS